MAAYASRPTCSKPSSSSALAQEADEAVHHARRRDHVGAGPRVRERRAAEVLQRRVVVDLAVRRRRRSGRGSCTRRSTRRRRRTSSGTAFLMARIARWTTPSSCHASLPTSSFFSGMPNRITAGMPSFATSSASRASLSTEKWNWPGSEEISRSHALARADEQRIDEVVGRERRLADQPAEGRRAAEAAGAGFGERHGASLGGRCRKGNGERSERWTLARRRAARRRPAPA